VSITILFGVMIAIISYFMIPISGYLVRSFSLSKVDVTAFISDLI